MKQVKPDLGRRAFGAFQRAFESPLNQPDDVVRQFLLDMGDVLDANRNWLVTTHRSDAWPHDDELRGWRFVHVINTIMSEEEKTIIDRWVRDEVYRDDPFTVRNVQRAGRNRVCRLSGLTKEIDWRDTAVAELVQASGACDRIVGVHTLTPNVEFHLGFDRHDEDGDFDDVDMALLEEVVENFRAIGARLALTFGILPGQTKLTNRERETLLLVLRDASESAISEQMGITQNSAHQYVVRLYRKLNVSSRSELMLRWLNPTDAIGEKV